MHSLATGADPTTVIEQMCLIPFLYWIAQDKSAKQQRGLSIYHVWLTSHPSGEGDESFRDLYFK